jgi:hypothetical protein
MASVTVRDESRPGRVLSELTLVDVPESLTLCALIRTRVREEVAIANLERSKPRHLLVQPVDAEVTLNGFRVPPGRVVDWEVFLPFPEDERFSIILSKAFLLAADDRITDPSITRQIRRS